MAKNKAAKKRPVKKAGGPYLAAAFFCESTIEDKQDGALTAVRIIDTITFQIDPSAPDDFPSETKRLPVPVSGILSFKTGDSPGDHTIRLVAQSPSGKSQTILEKVVPFTLQPQGGANIRLNQVIQVKQGGLFWIHVFLDGKQVTRMPLMISVQRAVAAPNQPVGGHGAG